MDAETRKLYEMKAEVLSALAHPIRVAVVELLREGEQCVCDIAERLGAERSNVSRHLAVMLRMIYRLMTPCVADFLQCATTVLRAQIEANNAALERL